MGITANFIQDHLYFGDVKDPQEELGGICVADPELVFEGYEGKHYYRSYKHPEIIANTKDVDGKTKILGMSSGIRGDRNFFLQIVKDLGSKGDLEHTAICAPLISKTPTLFTHYQKRTTFPVSFINADVLPSFRAGTTVYGQATGFVTDVRFASSPEELFDPSSGMDFEEFEDTEGLIYTEGHGQDVRCKVWGLTDNYLRTQDSSYVLIAEDGTKVAHPGINFTEVDTNLGEIYLVIPPSLVYAIEEYEKNTEVIYDTFIQCTFHLVFDVAIGEYQGGAVFDESHLVRVLADALENGNFNRLEKALADDVMAIGKKTTWNKESTLEQNRTVFLPQLRKDERLVCDLERVTKVLKDTSPGVGRLGVRLCDPKTKEILGHAFLEMNDRNRIQSITYFYGDDLFEAEVLRPEDLESFGIVASRLADCPLRTEDEWLDVLGAIIKNRSTDFTELYIGFVDYMVYGNPFVYPRGKGSAYYRLRSLLNHYRDWRVEVKKEQNQISVTYIDDRRGVANTFSFDLSVSSAGAIFEIFPCNYSENTISIPFYGE